MSLSHTTRIGFCAGLIGGVTIWIYELVVWVHFLRLRTVIGLFENSAVLVLGERVHAWPHAAVLAISAGVHFVTAGVWGVVYAWVWRAMRRTGVEATLLALVFGVIAWVVMHNLVLAYLSPVAPVYTTYVVLNGIVSHTFAFAVPVALWVKSAMR